MSSLHYLSFMVLTPQNSTKPTLGVSGHAPSKTTRYGFLFFSRKEAKALVLLCRMFVSPNLGEADPEGLGACPQ
jgi:hypothetical protein